MSEQLAADLGAGIRTDRLQHVIVLAPRDTWVDAVDAAGRAEHELPGAVVPRELQEKLSPGHVDFLMTDRVFDRRPDARARGEVHDDVIGRAGERGQRAGVE